MVAAVQSYATLTTNTSGANGSLLNPTVVNSATAMYSATSLCLSLTVPQGSTATADMTIEIQPLN